MHTDTATLPDACRAILHDLAASVPGLCDTAAHRSGSDPVARLQSLCRKGEALCLLFNTLHPQAPVEYMQPDGSPKSARACVGHFLVACHQRLGMDHKDLFTVNDLFHEDDGLSKVVQTLQHLLHELHNTDRNQPLAEPTADACSTRERVLTELLDTERRYVQDLDALEHYRMEAQSQQVLPTTLIRRIFNNLQSLLAFQRLLLAYAENIVSTHAPPEQRFGRLFVDMEEGFSVYEPYCANIQRAQDIIVQESGKLQKLAHIMNPHFELPSMLIKPVQRVCKYPLLLQELIKATPEAWPTHDELKHGLEAMQRVTTRINETKRGQENATVVQNVIGRVKDRWKREIPGFGLLLLHEHFDLERHGTENHVQLYLFEKALLICERAPRRKSSISVSMKKKSRDASAQALTVRGRILVSQMVQVRDISMLGCSPAPSLPPHWSHRGHRRTESLPGQYMLKVFWSEREPATASCTVASCTIKCRNREQLKQWSDAFAKRIQHEKARARKSAASVLVPRPAAPPLFLFSEDAAAHGGHYRASSWDEHDEDYSDMIQSVVDEEDVDSSPMATSRLAERAMHMDAPDTTPGMVLPPLPGKDDYAPQPPLFYPSSPLSPSYPPTPSTLSTRASMCSSIGGLSFSSWPATPRKPSDASGLAADYSIVEACADEEDMAGDDDGSVLITRTRSRSSPNIGQSWYQDALHPLDLAPPPPQPPQPQQQQQQTPFLSSSCSSSSGSALSTGHVDNIKTRLCYKNELYLVIVPMNIGYNELVRRAEAKMRQCGISGQEKTLSGSTMTLKYRDEDGDMITIGSDDEVQMAFEYRQENNAINLYIY